VSMPAPQPMHGEVSTTVNYRVLRGGTQATAGVARRARRSSACSSRCAVSAASAGAGESGEGLASTQVMDEIFPSSSSEPTDPLVAYFLNYGDPTAISIGPGAITGPDKQYFAIVPLSEYAGSTQTPTDCGSEPATLHQSTSASAASECGIAVRFTPPEPVNPYKVYYEATLEVKSSAGGPPIPVSLIGCDARAAEASGQSCYLPSSSPPSIQREQPVGPHQQQKGFEQELGGLDKKEVEENEHRTKLEEEVLTAQEHGEFKRKQQLEDELEGNKHEEEQTQKAVTQTQGEVLTAKQERERTVKEYGGEEALKKATEAQEKQKAQEKIENEILQEFRELGEALERGAGEQAKKDEQALKDLEQELDQAIKEIEQLEQSLPPEDEAGSASSFSDYVDPSGTVYVKTAEGGKAPLAGATVTLESGYSESGPFEAVQSGSTVMSPANRVNPGTTNGEGHFGWDVLAGYYKVAAAKSGCTPAPAETGVLSVPPPATNLELELACASAPSLSADEVSVSSSAPTTSFGEAVTFTAQVSKGASPTGTVTFYDGEKAIGEGPVALIHEKASLTVKTLPPGEHTIAASYSGDGANRPGISAAITQTVKAPAAIEETTTTSTTTSTSTASSTGTGGTVTTTTARTTTTAAGTPIATGTAQAGGAAPVKDGVAAIRLTCSGPGACTGTLELIARITHAHARGRGGRRRTVRRHGGPRTAGRRGRRRGVRRTRNVVIGTAAFSLARGAGETLDVHLSATGRRLLRKAGKRGLRVSVAGSGVEAGSLVLRAAQPKGGHGKRRRGRHG
jgi:hypothetical protein